MRARDSTLADRLSLASPAQSLAEIYDAALVDLDGVVYVGDHAVPGVQDAISRARSVGMRLAFVTNNAFRTPDAVARRLQKLGIDAKADDVVTSSQAAAVLLRTELPQNARVLVVGGPGLTKAITEAGFVPVHTVDDKPAAVVQGYSPDLSYAELAEAALAVRAGALWVATNLDATLPDPRGELPGNGSLVALVRAATGAQPVVAGKPMPALIQEAARRVSSRRPLVVGDRLDTDITAARRAGMDSMLVLTGVSQREDLAVTAPDKRPTYVAESLSGLFHSADQLRVDD